MAVPINVAQQDPIAKLPAMANEREEVRKKIVSTALEILDLRETVDACKGKFKEAVQQYATTKEAAHASKAIDAYISWQDYKDNLKAKRSELSVLSAQYKSLKGE
jgi:predicted  nucleic acid-binding Zn-ribbon protein